MKGNYHFGAVAGARVVWLWDREKLLVVGLHSPDFFPNQALGHAGNHLPGDGLDSPNQQLDHRFGEFGEGFLGNLLGGPVESALDGAGTAKTHFWVLARGGVGALEFRRLGAGIRCR